MSYVALVPFCPVLLFLSLISHLSSLCFAPPPCSVIARNILLYPAFTFFLPGLVFLKLFHIFSVHLCPIPCLTETKALSYISQPHPTIFYFSIFSHFPSYLLNPVQFLSLFHPSSFCPVPYTSPILLTVPYIHFSIPVPPHLSRCTILHTPTTMYFCNALSIPALPDLLLVSYPFPASPSPLLVLPSQSQSLTARLNPSHLLPAPFIPNSVLRTFQSIPIPSSPSQSLPVPYNASQPLSATASPSSLFSPLQSLSASSNPS